MNNSDKIGLTICIIIVLILMFVYFKIIPDIIGYNYTIQDVYLWCCNNLNESISPTGDNCSKIINNVYGGMC